MPVSKSLGAKFARLCTAALAMLLLTAPLAAHADGPTPGQAAPEIELVDLAGKPLKLSALAGKVVLVDFWASWCAPCREELPVLEKLYKAYAAQGLVIVGVNIDKEAKLATDFLAKHKFNLTFPIVNDKAHDVAKRYAPPTMPSSYLIGRDGKVRYVHVGFRGSDEAKMEAEIKTLLK